jgi:hypothetical protein
MDAAWPSPGGEAASRPANRRRWRLWLAIIGFVLGVVPAGASWSFLLYLFHIANGAGGVPPVSPNVDPQTQRFYLATFGDLSVFTFAASPIGFLISLWVILLDAMAGLFHPWRLGLALVSLSVSAGPTALLLIYVIAVSMMHG